MFRVVFFLLPRIGLIAIFVCAASPGDAISKTHYSSIARCSNLQFEPPNSPDLSKCPDCSVDAKGVLKCKCFADDQKTVKESSLAIYSCPRNYAYPRCAEPIKVIDGELYCRKISEESTYQKQCWSCSSDGSLLKCDCWHENREHQTSVLNTKDCQEPISSCEGILTCGLCPAPKHPELLWMRPVLLSVGISLPFVILVRYVWVKYVRG